MKIKKKCQPFSLASWDLMNMLSLRNYSKVTPSSSQDGFKDGTLKYMQSITSNSFNGVEIIRDLIITPLQEFTSCFIWKMFKQLGFSTREPSLTDHMVKFRNNGPKIQINYGDVDQSLASKFKLKSYQQKISKAKTTSKHHGPNFKVPPLFRKTHLL